MAYSPLTGGETDADSPTDQTLWTKVKDNFDFLKTRSEGQTVNTQDGSYTTNGSATNMPSDDTIPQNTKGEEYMTLSITPNSSTSKLRIDVVLHLSATAGNDLICALFQDTTANALASTHKVNSPTNNVQELSFTHYMTSGTTSATTFKVRAGSPSTGTDSMNGTSSGRLLGGVMSSSITITEIP